MKKTLLGTTALVTAGLLAAPALASDPLKVTVGGSIVTGFYAIDSDKIGGTSFQKTKVPLVARNIDITAEGTLDNGIVAGVNAKLMLGNDWEGTSASNDTNFRQLFAYLEGGFGRVEIGGTDGAAYKMHYTSPWFVPGNGVDSPNIYNHALSPVRQSTFSLLATDANKVSYFTPRIGGFQLGLSYTPEVSSNAPAANGLGLQPRRAQAEEVFEVALNFAGTFGAVDLGVDGFYVSGKAPVWAPGADPEEYGVGANIGVSGFTLGGAYYESKDVIGPGANVFLLGNDIGAQVWTAGLKYGTGPWSVGVAYLSAEGKGTLVGNDNKSWQLGGGYNIGAGVDVGLDLQLNKIDVPGAGTFDAKSAGLVLAIAF